MGLSTGDEIKKCHCGSKGDAPFTGLPLWERSSRAEWCHAPRPEPKDLTHVSLPARKSIHAGWRQVFHHDADYKGNGDEDDTSSRQ
jgi:hypothetical protein